MKYATLFVMRILMTLIALASTTAFAAENPTYQQCFDMAIQAEQDKMNQERMELEQQMAQGWLPAKPERESKIDYKQAQVDVSKFGKDVSNTYELSGIAKVGDLIEKPKLNKKETYCTQRYGIQNLK